MTYSKVSLLEIHFSNKLEFETLLLEEALTIAQTALMNCVTLYGKIYEQLFRYAQNQNHANYLIKFVSLRYYYERSNFPFIVKLRCFVLSSEFDELCLHRALGLFVQRRFGRT